MSEKAVALLRSAVWAALLVLLPVTSMPLIKTMIGSSAVASPSILALMLLILIWLLPYLIRRGRIPIQTTPLIVFALVALLTALAAFYRVVPAFKDQTIFRRELEAFITLAVGFSYLLVTATFVRTRDDLQKALRWINIGGMLLILWSAAQAAAWFGAGRYPEWMRAFQDFLSLGPLYRQRVTGFAIEPSWLAHQLNMLYLPLWLGASAIRTSVYRFRLWRFTIENFLLAGGVVTLLLSFSRVGYAAFLISITFLFISFNVWLFKKVRAMLMHRNPDSRPQLLSAGLIAILLITYLVFIGAGLYVFSRVDPRMADVFKISNWTSGGFLDYANQLQFGERAVYWQAGWGVLMIILSLGWGWGMPVFTLRRKSQLTVGT